MASNNKSKNSQNWIAIVTGAATVVSAIAAILASVLGQDGVSGLKKDGSSDKTSTPPITVNVGPITNTNNNSVKGGNNNSTSSIQPSLNNNLSNSPKPVEVNPRKENELSKSSKKTVKVAGQSSIPKSRKQNIIGNNNSKNVQIQGNFNPENSEQNIIGNNNSKNAQIQGNSNVVVNIE